LLGLRIGAKPQVIVTSTPRPIPLCRAIIADPDTVDVQRSSYDNMDNLSPVYIRKVIQPREGTRLGRQEIGGEVLDDTPGALWKRQAHIEAHRVARPPELKRIAVGLDPSATATGNEAGIVAAGLGVDDHVYVLEDDSLQAAPMEWASESVAAYWRWGADVLLGEANHGGDMIETIIRLVVNAEGKRIGQNVSYRALHASHGKYARAEPVQALYARGLAHHCGTFPDLEDEMCNWEPTGKAPSPNRLDALVWAITDLALSEGVAASAENPFYD
jgi:phage terminase large subunit-like protein